MKNPHKKKKRTPNPLFIPAGSTISLDVLTDPDAEVLAGMAADLAIRQAVSRCSASEKLFIAAAIPAFLGMIRLAKKHESPMSSAPTPDEAAPSGEAK
jgi:hypothetical protein